MRARQIANAGAVLAGYLPLLALAQNTAIQDVTPQQSKLHPIDDRRFIGARQTNGDAKWLAELARQVYSICPDEDVETRDDGSRPDVDDVHKSGECVRHTLFVRNDSKIAIQCKSTLELAGPDHLGETRLEDDHVIFPSTEEAVLRSYADTSSVTRNYSTNCLAIPAGPLAPLSTPAECRPSLSGPSPDEFYPAASKRRQEQGAVTLEFSVSADTIPADVRIASSSGFADLDTAALRYAKYLRAKSSCAGVRTRMRVRFVIAE
jgi:TonB family protein